MSGSIADKIEYLQGTKEAIANAIIEQGVEVTEQDTFRSYATKISQLGSPIKSVANTSSTTLILDESGQLTSNVNISSAENNLITVNEDGLFLDSSSIQLGEAIYLIDKFEDGNNGYRLYSNGICEQWAKTIKKVTTDQTITWTFLKPLKSKPYLYRVSCDKYYTGSTSLLKYTSYDQQFTAFGYQNGVTNTGIMISLSGLADTGGAYYENFSWYAVGEVAL